MMMMMVSPSFDILMFHPGLEATWHRSGSTFLGKKCYREVEKRDEPCPHCPGVVALKTGKMNEAETCAVLDDGTRVPFLLRAFPIYGVRGEPAGFVETCENIAERRRGEDDARLAVTLMNELLVTSSTSRVLVLGLDAALRLEGAQAGCVFAVDSATGIRELVAQRGFLPSEIESSASFLANAAAGTPDDAPLLKRVPVLCNREPVAELVVRLPGDAPVWPGSRPRLEAVASFLASALARIKAERLRGDAGMNIQTIISAVPMAILCLDNRGMVTVWNEGAERMFGWTERDARGHIPCFVPNGEAERFSSLVSEGGGTSQSPGFKFPCLRTDERMLDVWFRVAPIRDLIGDGTSHLVIATSSESGAQSLADSDASAPKVRATPLRVAGLVQDVVDQDILVAADALERLFNRISRGLLPTQNSQENLVQGDSDPCGDMVRRSISVSWAKDGSLDFRVSMPAAEADLTRVAKSAQALVIQSDEENGRCLEGILRDLGCSTTVFTSISAAIGHLRALQDGGEPPDLAIVEMVMPEEPGAVEAAKLLRAVEPRLQVVVSSDRSVVGHTAHGFAAAISRPYANDTVKTAVIEALRQKTR
jgi:PAS domain-containing protein/CheY-like chemotaxis protein